MSRYTETISGSRKGTGSYSDEVTQYECKVEGELSDSVAEESITELIDDHSISKVVDLCNRQLKTDARNGNAGSTSTGQKKMNALTKEARKSGNVDMDMLAELIKKATASTE